MTFVDRETWISAALFVLAILAAGFSSKLIGVNRAVLCEFRYDILAWKAQRRSLNRWHSVYIAIFWIVIVYPVSLWHSIVLAFIPAIEFRQWWLLRFIPTPLLIAPTLAMTFAIMALWWVVFMAVVNTISRAYFPHSSKSRRIAHALLEMSLSNQNIRPHAEEIAQRIHVIQVDCDWVLIRHDLPIPALWFRQNKKVIASSANMRITDEKEFGEGDYAFKCEYINEDVKEVLAGSDWVENQVYTYFFKYADKDGEVCKIGRTNNVENTLRACRRWHPSAEVVLYLLESELSENEAHELFADMRKDGEVFIWEGQVKEFVETRRMQAIES